MRKLFLFFVAFLSFSLAALAQQKNSDNSARIEGVVLDATSGTHQPIGFASVVLSPQEIYTTTDEKGRFTINGVSPGKTSLQVQFIGMQTIDTVINIVGGREYNLRLFMEETSFRLEDVVVVATQNKAGSATASNISRQAMDHMQTSSIKDVMLLLPGAELDNPSLSSANTFMIRTIGSVSTSNDDMNALGTSVMIDGAPLSNNANMQTLAPTISGSSASVGGGASPNSGVDLRILSTDNVENVEVIRGIASVEYGDMTSGVVNINSKVGVEPLSIRFKTNPSIYQLSLSKGLDLHKAGTLYLNGDYAYNTTKQTESYAYYQRFNLKGNWMYIKDSWNFVTSLGMSYGKDTRERNPNDMRSQIASGARDLGVRVTHGGTYSPYGSESNSGAGWFKYLKYNLSFSYTDKHSFYESLLENAFAPYSMSTTDGAILSNRPGQHVYDESGNEITNIPSDETGLYATYLPNAYFSHYDIYGKELNVFAKVKALFGKRWERINNNIMVGADFKTDGNLGKGIVYDLENPPFRNSSVSNASYRPRKFSDIPFINQLGVYAEDAFTASLGERDLNITAGLRFDWIEGKSAVTPRINASFDILPEILTLRGGYGVNIKAPTALYLYPQDAYFDYINFNNLGDESYAENEQLLIATTKVFSAENPDLKLAKNHKSEIGLNWFFNKKRMKVYLTAYYEELKDGYNLGRDLNSFKLIPYEVYEIYKDNPGSIPVLQLAQTYNVFARVSSPMNNIFSTNKGIEYEIDLGRINAIRTSFYINGAWMKTSTTNKGYSFSTLSNGNNLEANIGVYEKGVETDCVEKLNTRFMITHNIPKIGFVVSLTANVDWKYKYWTEYGNDTMFEKYISYKDGKVYDFDPAMKDDPEFAYLFPALDDRRFEAETYFPTVIFNFQLSKEIGNLLTASFFVNNLFNSRPLFKSKIYPGSYTELGIPTFFGFDLKINIR